MAGQLDDPQTEKRKVVFEPIVRMISDKMEEAHGSAGNIHAMQKQPEPTHHTMPTKYIICPKCKETIAILIFSESAFERDVIEDTARISYSKVKEEKLPAWVIGTLQDDYPKPTARAYVLKVWPEREEIKLMHPDKFNRMIDKLILNHCS